MKDLILLNINNLYILHYNDPLIPKWWLVWFNGIGRWRNPILLLETILVPTYWVLIVMIKNLNMSCIDLLSLAHCLYMDKRLEVHPRAWFKSSLHLIWNMVWYLCRKRITRHTIVFISWTWAHCIILRRLIITYHISMINISLIWWVTKLSPHTHRLKIGWKWVLVKWCHPPFSSFVQLPNSSYIWTSSSRAMVFILCAWR